MELKKLEPNDRLILLVVTEDEKYVLRLEQEVEELIKQPKVKIISDKEFNKLGFKYVGSEGRLGSGKILLLSPFAESTYLDVQGARQLVSIEKMHTTARLCQLLGARSVSTKRLEIIDKKRNEKLSWNADVVGFSGKLSSKEYDEESLTRSLQLDIKFPGKSANIKEAQKFFYTSRLDSDTVLQNIIQMMLDINPPTEITQEILLSESLNSSINLLASLNLPDIFTKLKLQSLLSSSSSVEFTISERIEIYSRFHVIF